MNPSPAPPGRQDHGPCNGHRQLRSTPGPTAKAYVIFKNRSKRVVDILWLNRTGVRVNYTKNGLRQGHKMHMNTFEGHPWIFRDHRSGDKLVFTTGTDRHRKEVFFPVPANEDNPIPTQVDIEIPVYTLRERSLQIVRTVVKNQSDFEKLEIPTMLRLQLANPEDTVDW